MTMQLTRTNPHKAPAAVRDQGFPPTARPTATLDLGADGICLTVANADRILASANYRGASPRELDRLIADRLVADGRIPAPRNDVDHAELHRLVGRGRARLAGADSVVLVGEHRIRMFRMSRADVEAATAPLARALAARIELMLGTKHAADAPVILTATHTRWPGLSAQLTRALGHRVHVLDDADSHRTHVPPPPRPSTVREPNAVAVTEVLTPVESEPEPESEPGPAGRPDGVDGLSAYDSLVPATVDLPVAAAPADARSAGQRRLLGGAAAGVLVVFGVVTAVTIIGDDEEVSPSPVVAGRTPADQVAATPLPQTDVVQPGVSGREVTGDYADPADLIDARRTAVHYTEPPPPPPSPVQTTRAQTSRERPSRRSAPRTRSHITIPIPGAPPIVLP
ncbi:MAG: hypothetical protein QM662_11685 [Gordonia sp. (in: high G+C Gram-positive bacteria)]